MPCGPSRTGPLPRWSRARALNPQRALDAETLAQQAATATREDLEGAWAALDRAARLWHGVAGAAARPVLEQAAK